MAKTRAIIKRPDEAYGHMTNISITLENLQKIVEGYIEAIMFKPGVAIICNEEGKLRGLPANMKFHDDTLVGTIIVIGVDGEEFCDTPVEFSEWKEIVKRYNKEVR